MNLSERLSVLMQASTLAQKTGVLTLEEAVKAKSAMDIISTGVLNQNYTSAINALIEIAVASQKKGAYTLQDAHMIYLAVEGIESEFQNTVNKIEMGKIEEVRDAEKTQKNGNETIVSVPPVTLKKKS